MKFVIDLEKGIGKELLIKYPGGSWITMHGKHVYIKADGQIADETPVEPQEKSKTPFAKAKPLLAALKDELVVGQLYKYGNSTVKIDKIGTKWIYGTSASGKEIKIDKAKLGSQQWEATKEEPEATKEEPKVTDEDKLIQAAKDATDVNDLLSKIYAEKLTGAYNKMQNEGKIKNLTDLFDQQHKPEDPGIHAGEYWKIKGVDKTYKIQSVEEDHVMLVSDTPGSKGIKSNLVSFLANAEKTDIDHSVQMIVDLAKDAGTVGDLIHKIMDGGLSDKFPDVMKAEHIKSVLELFNKFHGPTTLELFQKLAKDSSSYGNFCTEVHSAGLAGEVTDLLGNTGHGTLQEFYQSIHPVLEHPVYKPGVKLKNKATGVIYHVDSAPNEKGHFTYHQDQEQPGYNTASIKTMDQYSEPVSEEDYAKMLEGMPKPGDKFAYDQGDEPTAVTVDEVNGTSIRYHFGDDTHKYWDSRKEFEKNFPEPFDEEAVAKAKEKSEKALRDKAVAHGSLSEFQDSLNGKLFTQFHAKANKEFPSDPAHLSQLLYFKKLKGLKPMTDAERTEALEYLDELAKKHYDFDGFKKRLFESEKLQDMFTEVTGGDVTYESFHSAHKAVAKKQYTKAEAIEMLTPVAKTTTPGEFLLKCQSDPDLENAFDRIPGYNHVLKYQWLMTNAMTPEEKKAKVEAIEKKIKAEPNQSSAHAALNSEEKNFLLEHSEHASLYEAWSKVTNNGADVDTSDWAEGDTRWEALKIERQEQKIKAFMPEAEKEVAKITDSGIFDDEVAKMDLPALTEHVKKLLTDKGVNLGRGEDSEAFRGAFEKALTDASVAAQAACHDYEKSRRIQVRQARFELALNRAHGDFFKPMTPAEALERFPFHIYHGTSVQSAKGIVRTGFRLRGTDQDFGDAAYFKTPIYDPHEKHQSDKAKGVVDYFRKSEPAVVKASLRMKPEEYLDIKALGERPQDLDEMIQAWGASGIERRAQQLAIYHGKTIKELGLMPHGNISTKVLGELESALPPDKKKIMDDAVSPYEVYCRLRGYKAVNDILDHFQGEGWQLGVYDPDAIEIEDIGWGVNSPGDGGDLELDKSINTDKREQGNSYSLHHYGYQDGKLTLHVNAHMDDYAPSQEDVTKSIETDNPGGHWVTMHGRHVYIGADGEMLPATAPTNFQRKPVVMPKEDALKRISSGAHLGGAGKKDIYGDEAGKQYIFKPGISKSGLNEPFRAHVQGAVGTIGERILDDSVPITTRTLGGKLGSLQPLVPGVKGDLKKLHWQDLKPEQIRMIQQEHVLDWVVGNFDAHAGNFIITEDGRVLGVDKEQAFRYMKDQNSHKMSTEYHPNEAYGEWEPLYNTMYRDFANEDFELDLQAVLPAIQRLEAISDGEYREILKPYANSLGMGEAFLDKAVERKNDTREQFRSFFSELTGEDFTFGDELTKAIPIVVLEKGIVPDMEKGIGKDMLSKYPGGQWVTMRGRHVYIMSDGHVSKETDPGITKSRDVAGQASKLQEHDPKEIEQGAVYRYGNSTVKAEKVGRSYVHVSDTNGKTFTVPKDKFKAKVESTPEVKGKDNQQPEANDGADGKQNNGSGIQAVTPQTQSSPSQPQIGSKFKDGEGQDWKIIKQGEDGNFVIEQEKAGKSKMNAQQRRVFNNTGGMKRVSASQIDLMARQGQSYSNNQKASSEEMQQAVTSPPPAQETANNPQDNGTLDQQTNGTSEVENGSEQDDNSFQDTPNPDAAADELGADDAPGGGSSSSFDQHDQTLDQSKVFPETEVLSGSKIGDQVDAIYKEWNKQGNTYFAPYFVSAGDGKGLAYDHGSPDYSKHTIRSLKGKDGKPAGLSYTIDQGDHIHVHYAEVAPAHRATTGQKASKNKSREKGIGARMIAEAVQQAFDSGYNGRVELDAISAEDPQKFYKKLGFTNQGQGLHFSIEGDAAKKLIEGVQARYGKGKLQKALDTQQQRFPTYQEPSNEDEKWRQIEELEDKLDGFIAGPASARAKKGLADRRLTNRPKTIDSNYEGLLPNREEEEEE